MISKKDIRQIQLVFTPHNNPSEKTKALRREFEEMALNHPANKRNYDILTRFKAM